LNFAIRRQVDSILIGTKARTPLIISGTAEPPARSTSRLNEIVHAPEERRAFQRRREGVKRHPDDEGVKPFRT
jgi:preprotein translocase subunit SecA